MRYLLCTVAVLLSTTLLYAQAPNKMSYQMVVRNSSNAIVANQTVGVKISIVQGLATGSAVFAETHSPLTNINGLASFVIGDGSSVTGSLANIKWAQGPFFIKTEVDPSGGTNYTITSTTQLLSVPYALHAGSVPSQGKTYLVLQGGMTNAEAAEYIAAEGGPQTQFVYIEGTTSLTHIDLTPVTNLLELKINENQDLVSVTAPNLKSVSTKLEFNLNPALTVLSFPALNKLGGSSTIEWNASLETLSFPALITSVKGGLRLTNNVGLSKVDFPLLERFGGFFIENNPLLTSFEVPKLTSAGFTVRYSNFTSFSAPLLANGYLTFHLNPVLGQISFPQLTNGTGVISISGNPALLSANFPKLSTAASIQINNTSLTSISFPVLSNLTGDLSFTGNPGITSLVFPQLVKSTNIKLEYENSITSVSFPELVNSENISIKNAARITSVSFPKLSGCYDLVIKDANNLSSLELSQLSTSRNITINGGKMPVVLSSLTTAGNITIAEGSTNTSVDLSSLKQCETMYIATSGSIASFSNLVYANTVEIYSSMSSLSFPSLKMLLSNLFISGSNLSSISLPNLDTVANIKINFTNLAAISFPQLRIVKLSMLVNNNANLASISFPVLNGLGTDITQSGTNILSLNNNKLPSSEVNAILARLVAINPPIANRRIDLKQLPAAPPTGQGLTDKAILVSRPNIVNTD